MSTVLAWIHAKDVASERRTNYPEPFAQRVAGRERRRLGNAFGLRNFGVNLTRLEPGAQSALRHSHSRQDEFVYVLAGDAVLVTDEGEFVLGPGDCAGFAAGGQSHHLINRSTTDVVYLEIGDRTPSDAVSYPGDDLAASLAPDGHWRFVHKDGQPY